MKNIILGLSISALLIGSCFADAISIRKLGIPDVKTGIYYDFDEKTLDQTTAANIINIPLKIKDKDLGKLEFDAGYTVQNKILVGVSYNLGNFEKFGWEVPLKKYLDVSLGIAGSYHYEREQTGFGIYCTIIRFDL